MERKAGRACAAIALAVMVAAGPAAAKDGQDAPAAKDAGYRPEMIGALQADRLVDLVAADFFETGLRLSQSMRIEAETARRYLSMDGAARAQFRAERKEIWRSMSKADRRKWRNAKSPVFIHLDEAQKTTFRRIAAEQLGGAADTPTDDGV